ncbi:DUF389 domain-containing protein [Altererythrobacter sp. ZODW24]|uniref:DUF389 domain-containing protein n=1 Tax=Altererythrobacter sp. ZODW24 TaxID=2185142 RepID=UPI000DF73710|nr:DUF389 domain-containing protein [Altererythrobacter sp. ZODW24]
MATEPKSLKAEGFSAVLLSWRRWWRDDVVGTVDQASVIEKRRVECKTSARYLFMTAMSAGIAVLGLLLSSPAVVIGAMLLSPLMDPIMGAGFSLAIGDYKWLRESARSLAWGTVMAIGLCALIVFLSPLQTVTAEIAARTRPNLFDLLVALFSALAGAYAMIRGREGTIVGVAIATALMPPLAVVGFGLATLNWTVFSGALLLYVTNLMTIALTAALMARIYGFRTSLSDRQTQFQTFGIISVFVALAIPLGISLGHIRSEALAARVIRAEIVDAFGANARISELNITHEANLIRVSATVLTPEIRDRAQEESGRAMERQLDEPVQLTLQQYKVETGASAAEEAQLAAASAQERLASQRRAQDLADRLALIAGVPATEVMVDRERRRALVKARALPGAELGTYRELESRIAATEPEWKIEIRPPARALPQISLVDGELTDDGRRALELIKWSAQRMDTPIVLSGRSEALEIVAPLLTAAGVQVSSEPGRGTEGQVSARWGAPDN